MADVIDSAVAKVIVGLLYERAAQSHCGGASELAVFCAAIGLLAVLNLIITASREVESLFGKGADRCQRVILHVCYKLTY